MCIQFKALFMCHRAAAVLLTHNGEQATLVSTSATCALLQESVDSEAFCRRSTQPGTILWRDPGRLRLSQGASLKPDESEGCSPVSGGRTIRLCSSWPSDDPHTALRSSVDTGAGDRGGAPAEFAVVAETVGCREDTKQIFRSPIFRTFPSEVTRGLHPTPPFNPRVGTQASPKVVKYREGLVDTQHPPCHVRCPPSSVCLKSVEDL